MDLELTADQLELRDAARQVLAGACPPSVPRAVHEGTGDGAALWKTLCRLDWPGLGIGTDHGGLGFGPVEVGVVVEELGRVVAPTPYLATVTQFVPAVAASGSAFRLEEVAAGTITGTLAVAGDRGWTVDTPAVAVEPDGAGWRLSGAAAHVVDGATATEMAVVAGSADGVGLFVVAGEDAHAEAVTVIDPTVALATVHFDGVTLGGERVLVAPGAPGAEDAVTRALQEATAALALSTVATCRAIFEATVDYATQREQFGRPIGSFQAVKHRLADCYLAVERAHALAWFAQATLAEDDARRPVAVAMAKAAAGDCQRLLTRDGLQLHGGIGFTWEHDLHLHLKRAISGASLFGSAAHHRAHLARQLGLEAA